MFVPRQRRAGRDPAARVHRVVRRCGHRGAAAVRRRMTGIAAITVAAVAVVLVVADATTATIARRRVARLIAAAWRTTSAPDIRVTGPFLVQLVSGVYRQVKLTVPAFTAAGMELTDLVASLRGVRAPITRLLAGDGIVVTE